MKKARSAACALCLALLAPLAIHALRVLPTDRRALVAEKYAGWSGVLRLWVQEDAPVGDGRLTTWLNGCVARFEKRHPGVYVQPQSVDAGAMADFLTSGIRPPDMLLFAPGTLDGPAGLAPIEIPANLRDELRHCGAWGNACFAAPVALGGYLWAWNPALTDGVPGNWRESGATLAVLPADRTRRFDAALLALCSGYHEKAREEAPLELPGVDLGLGGSATAAAPTAGPAGLLPCALPEGFDFDGDAFTRFCNGEAAATVVTPREVRRLEQLGAQGRGPDWRLSPGGAAFTDQLLCLAIVDREAGQGELCRAFLDCLLEEESQSALAAAGACPVTDAPIRSGGADPLHILDSALRRPGLAAPNCLDKKWPETAREIVRKFLAGDGESPALWRALAERLNQNPNIQNRP